MKKIITFLMTFVIAISCVSISAFAVDTSRVGTFYTDKQVAQAKDIKDKYDIDAVFYCTNESMEDANALAVATSEYLAKNKLTEKYFIFSLSSDYYYYTWSDDLKDVFHSVDGDYIADTIFDNESVSSVSKFEDEYYKILSNMLENRTNAPYKYIKDQAGVLTDEQESKLNEKLTAFKEDNNLDLVVVLTNGIDNGSVYNDDRMAFADDYYDYNGYDKNGALLLVNIESGTTYTSGNSWISTSGKCIKLISDDDISSIGSKLTPILGAGEYYDAVDRFPDIVSGVISGNKMHNAGIIALITFIVCIIGAFVYTGRLKRQLKSVGDATDANNYIVDNSLNISHAYDHYLYSHVTKTAKESKSGSSTHTSSSGSSHGGGGF